MRRNGVSLAAVLGVLLAAVPGLAQPEVVLPVRSRWAGQPIPAGPEAYTYDRLHQDRDAWLRRTDAECYRRHSTRSEVWDAAALSFVDHMVERLSSDPSPFLLTALYQEAERVYGLGCRDALILYLRANLYHYVRGPAAALPLLAAAQTALAASTYPKFHLVLATRRWQAAALQASPKDAELQARLKLELARAFAQAMEDWIFRDGNQRLFVHELESVWDELKYEGGEGVLQELAQVSDADPWLRDLFCGRQEIRRAWKSRGIGLANTVTEAGWKGFNEHIRLAGEALQRAWELHPNWPEPAAEMITVCTALDTGDSQRQWFDRSVAAQLDWYPAYDGMLWAMLPRWGGSYDAMVDFGGECVGTGRYDTPVPRHLLKAFLDMGKDLPWEKRQGVLRRDGAAELFAKLCDGYAHREGSKSHDYWTSILAIVACVNQRYDIAAEAIGQLGGRLDLQACDDLWSEADEIVGEAVLLAGPQAGEARQGLELLAKGERDQAVPLLRRAMVEQRGRYESFAFLGRHIATVGFGGAPETSEIVLATMADLQMREAMVQAYVAAARDAGVGGLPAGLAARLAEYLGEDALEFADADPAGRLLSQEEADDLLRRVENAAGALSAVGAPGPERRQLLESNQRLAIARVHLARDFSKEGLGKASYEYARAQAPSICKGLYHRGLLLDCLSYYAKCEGSRQYYHRRRVLLWVQGHGIKPWDRQVDIEAVVGPLRQLGDAAALAPACWDTFWRWGSPRVGWQLVALLREKGQAFEARLMEAKLLEWFDRFGRPLFESWVSREAARGLNLVDGYENQVLYYASDSEARDHDQASACLLADAHLRRGQTEPAMRHLISAVGRKPDSDTFNTSAGTFVGTREYLPALVRRALLTKDRPDEVRASLSLVYPLETQGPGATAGAE